jgi:hypothetical protein
MYGGSYLDHRCENLFGDRFGCFGWSSWFNRFNDLHGLFRDVWEWLRNIFSTDLLLFLSRLRHNKNDRLGFRFRFRHGLESLL